MKEVHNKIAQGLEEIYSKISTQLKLLELAEKEIKRLITRNKRSEIENHLEHVKLKLEKYKKLSIQPKKFYSTKEKWKT